MKSSRALSSTSSSGRWPFCSSKLLAALRDVKISVSCQHMSNIRKIAEGKAPRPEQQRRLLVDACNSLQLQLLHLICWETFVFYLDVEVESLQTLQQVSLALFGGVGHKLHGHGRLP